VKFPQLEGSWSTDAIVSVDPPSAFRYDGAGFRLDGDDPYLRLHFVTIYVSDQERSLHFFVDQLGFSLVPMCALPRAVDGWRLGPLTEQQFW